MRGMLHDMREARGNKTIKHKQEMRSQFKPLIFIIQIFKYTVWFFYI